jgi:putative hydrolase of the HAD superfamily
MPLLLCDLDDTLIDRSAAFEAWAKSCAQAHRQGEVFVNWLIAEDADGYRPRDELWSAICARLELRESPSSFGERYRAELSSMIQPDHAVLEALRVVRASDWRVAIVTHGDSYQHRKLDAAGLRDVVDAICISESEGMRKPDPRLFEIAATRAGTSLEGAWMIGDNAVTDIGGAVNAGISSVWMQMGRQWPIQEYQPTLQASSFPEAVSLILRAAR